MATCVLGQSSLTTIVLTSLLIRFFTSDFHLQSFQVSTVVHSPADQVGRVGLLRHANKCELIAVEDFKLASYFHLRSVLAGDFKVVHAVSGAGFKIRIQLFERHT